MTFPTQAVVIAGVARSVAMISGQQAAAGVRSGRVAKAKKAQKVSPPVSAPYSPLTKSAITDMSCRARARQRRPAADSSSVFLPR
jgi:hypothetical protein